MMKAEAENSVEGTSSEAKPAVGLIEGPESGTKTRTSFVRRIFSVSLRLFIWYMVITAVFRCPSTISDLDSTSSRVCKPYLIGRSHLEPHIAPYYNAYGAPYVDAVRPYAETFHHQVYTPIASFSKSGYQTYAAPRVEQIQQAGYDKWDAVVVPKLKSIESQCLEHFDATIKPRYTYLENLVVPRYQSATAHCKSITDDYIMPSYMRLKPVLEKTYVQFHDFSTETLIPYTCKAWSSTITFITGTLRTQITTLYTENVEPQLVRIGAKLASYREARRSKPPGEEDESITGTLETMTATGLASEPTETITSSASTTSEATSETTSETHATPPQSTESVRERIITDLRSWQERFAIAADKGCQDLEERITRLVQDVSEEGGTAAGETLVSRLETVTDNELGHLKQTINNIVGSMPDLPTLEEEEVAHKEMIQALYSSGVAIRDVAHALREWYYSYDGKLVHEVDAAVSTTLDVLDSIRDLGLQEIGMRWAWLDGVTYKDWAKFHALKQRFSEWGNEVRDIGTQNTAFLDARSNATDIVSRGMDIAEKASKGLTALREIGKLKIQAGDSSDNFEVELIDPDVIQTRRKLMEERQAASELPSEGVAQYSADNDSEGEEVVGLPTSDEDSQNTISSDANGHSDTIPVPPSKSERTSTTNLAEPSNDASMEASSQRDNFEADTFGNEAENSCEGCVDDTRNSDDYLSSDSLIIPEEETLGASADTDGLNQDSALENDEDVEATLSQPPPMLTSTETPQPMSSAESIKSRVSESLESDLSKVSELYSEAVNEAASVGSDDVQETLEDLQRRRDKAIALALEQYSSAIKLAAQTPPASTAVPNSDESSRTASSASPTDKAPGAFETIVYSVDEDDGNLPGTQDSEADPLESELEDDASSDIEYDELVSDDTTHSEENSSATSISDDSVDAAHETFQAVSGDEDDEGEKYMVDKKAEEYPTEQFKNEL